jgi:hypothetical protein
MAGVRFRKCEECGKASAFPTNKMTCCLSKGKRRTTDRTLSISADELDSIVARQVALALEAQKDSRTISTSPFSDGATVLLSDIHIPLHHVRATHAVIKFCEDHAGGGWLKRLVLAGDVFDGTMLSRFHKSKRDEGHPFDIGQEIAEGKNIISDIADCFPEECWFLPGNHETRLWRALAANPGIPEEPLSFEEMFKFYEYPEKLKVWRDRKLSIGRGDEGSVYILHGEKYNKHRAAGLLQENLYQNSVQGHTHRPQTFWEKGRFGHVNGYLHDKDRQGYMADPEWTMGFTIFEHWDNGTKVNPYFVRITEDGSFSWNGKVYRG